MSSPAGVGAALLSRNPRRWLGLMSGTSCDGIDAAIVEVDGSAPSGDPCRPRRIEVVGGLVLPFEPETRDRLRGDLSSPPDVETAARWDRELGILFGSAALESSARFGAVDGIALSGHTFAHLPGVPTTLQLGSPPLVAELTGVPVVAGFRASDVARGGEGAPLVPAADRWLFAEAKRDVVVLNLGGISNATWLPAGGGEPRAADCGPGNLILDEIIRRETGEPFDRDGERAAAGRPSIEMAAGWLASMRLLAAGGPRSTGREELGESWVREHRDELAELDLADRLATIVEWIANAIASSLVVLGEGRAPQRILVGGGGVWNRGLVAALRSRLPAPPEVLSQREHGVDPDLREAVCFALLGEHWLRGFSASFPNTTGCHRAGPLGALWVPASGGRLGRPERPGWGILAERGSGR